MPNDKLPVFSEQIVVDSKLENVDDISMFVSFYLKNLEADRKAIAQINVAIDEIYSNIVKYGYKNKKGKIIVNIGFENDIFALQFIDDAPKFNPLDKDDPNIALAAEDRDIGGLGIFIVKNTMDDVLYEYINNQNVLTIVKKIK